MEHGFTPDDYFIEDGELSPDAIYDADIYAEAPEKSTYTEQANKRAHCQRLAWFVICNKSAIKDQTLFYFRIQFNLS